MGLETKLSSDGSVLNMSIDGRFDFNIHSAFRNSYRNLPPSTRFVIDLSKTTFMDSSAMGMLLLLREFTGKNGENIELCNCRPEVRKILAISNLDKMFTMK